MKILSKFNLGNYFTKQEIYGAIFVIVLFLIAIIVSYQYAEAIEELVVLGGPVGMSLYFLLTVASVVLAPMAAFPFLPIGVTLWGSLTTALLSVSGWTLGAIIAFVLAKKYGRPFVSKIISLDRAEKISKRIVGKNPFWPVVLLRVLLPTDITSYAIGLFVPIRLLPYALATLIGTTPLALAASYGVTLVTSTQLLLIVGVLAVIFAVVTSLLWFRTKKNSTR